MKKSILVSCMVAVASMTSIAQEYKPVKVGFGFGYASPAGEGAKGGVIIYLEPAYRISDVIAVGLRLEAAAMARSVVVTGSQGSASAETEVKANGSYTVNGQYYFSSGSFRPFAGAGFGLYTFAEQTVSATGSGGSISASASNNKFGFYPRVGFDIGHMTLQLEYNIIPASTAEIAVSVGTSTSIITSESKNSYLGIKLGFFVGGGKN